MRRRRRKREWELRVDLEGGPRRKLGRLKYSLRIPMQASILHINLYKFDVHLTVFYILLYPHIHRRND